jgi:hypothetical protein
MRTHQRSDQDTSEAPLELETLSYPLDWLAHRVYDDKALARAGSSDRVLLARQLTDCRLAAPQLFHSLRVS